MNDVHTITARKLRSLATAIRAERYAPHEFGVREAMEAEAVELEKRAAAIEHQAKAAFWELLKPTVEEDPDPQSTDEATAARTKWIRENRPDRR